MHLQQSFMVTWVKDTACPLNKKLICYLLAREWLDILLALLKQLQCCMEVEFLSGKFHKTHSTGRSRHAALVFKRLEVGDSPLAVPYIP